MIGHVSEVWVALFAAFAVGSLLGWLVYRWVDRSDYAFDQRELTDALGRRLRGEEKPAVALVKPTEAELRATQRERPIKLRSRTAEKFRSRVRASSVAAAWRASRNGEAEEVEAEEVVTAPVRAEAPRRLEAPKPSRVERPTPARALTRAKEDAGEEAWPPSSDPWPVQVAVWPALASPPRPQSRTLLLPPPGASSTPAHLFGQKPVHDEIWSSDHGIIAKPSRPAPSPRPAAKVSAVSRPPGLTSPPQRPDNLQLIKGIGPAFEKKLNQLGIYHYRQIAGWSPSQRDWVAQELTAARIEKDRWIDQATVLASGKGTKGAN